MRIAVDFDGTIVEQQYPAIGEEIPFATEILRRLIAERHQIILWTVREGTLLNEAVAWCSAHGIEFYAVNKNDPEEMDCGHNPYYSRKIKADFYIDDSNLGGLPDWGVIYRMIQKRQNYRTMIAEELRRLHPPKRKKKWGLF